MACPTKASTGIMYKTARAVCSEEQTCKTWFLAKPRLSVAEVKAWLKAKKKIEREEICIVVASKSSALMLFSVLAIWRKSARLVLSTSIQCTEHLLDKMIKSAPHLSTSTIADRSLRCFLRKLHASARLATKQWTSCSCTSLKRSMWSESRTGAAHFSAKSLWIRFLSRSRAEWWARKIIVPKIS